jgi:hypothetical protein
VSQPYGPSQPVTGIVLPYLYQSQRNFFLHDVHYRYYKHLKRLYVTFFDIANCKENWDVTPFSRVDATLWRHIPEVRTLHSNRCENFKSTNKIILFYFFQKV